MHAVIFDVDGTLVDSCLEDEGLYKLAVEAEVGPVSFRDLGDYEHVCDIAILRQVYADNNLVLDDAQCERICSDFCARLCDYFESRGPFPQIPGATRLLEKLMNSPRHDVAIATGGWAQSARLKLETSGFDIAGIPLASSNDADTRTRIMEAALAQLGLDFESVTYFGDAEWDQRACAALGWHFRAVGPRLNGLSSFDELELRNLP